MIINITLPTEDFKDTYTIEKVITKSIVKEVNRSDIDTLYKETSQGQDIYHIYDKGILPDLYYFVNTSDGSYNLVNTCIKYDDLDE